MHYALDTVDFWYHVAAQLTTADAWGLLHVSRAARGGFLAHKRNRDIYEYKRKALQKTQRLLLGWNHGINHHLAIDLFNAAYTAQKPLYRLKLTNVHYIDRIDPRKHFPELQHVYDAIPQCHLSQLAMLVMLKSQLTPELVATLVALCANVIRQWEPQLFAPYAHLHRQLLCHGVLLVSAKPSIIRGCNAAVRQSGGARLATCDIEHLQTYVPYPRVIISDYKLAPLNHNLRPTLLRTRLEELALV